jgi:tetratricopeptide (TPR) repeat protein
VGQYEDEKAAVEKAVKSAEGFEKGAIDEGRPVRWKYADAGDERASAGGHWYEAGRAALAAGETEKAEAAFRAARDEYDHALEDYATEESLLDKAFRALEKPNKTQRDDYRKVKARNRTDRSNACMGAYRACKMYAEANEKAGEAEETLKWYISAQDYLEKWADASGKGHYYLVHGDLGDDSKHWRELDQKIKDLKNKVK